MEEYDFQQFNNSDNDSDFADHKTLKAIQGHVKQEPGAADTEKPKRDPSAPIDPFKNTKFEQQVSLPGQSAHDKAYERNADGTIKYTKEQKEMIKDRAENANQRVTEKLAFANDVNQVSSDTHLLVTVNSAEGSSKPLVEILDRN